MFFVRFPRFLVLWKGFNIFRVTNGMCYWKQEIVSIVCGGKPTGFFVDTMDMKEFFGRIWDSFYVLEYIINTILLNLFESEKNRNQILYLLKPIFKKGILSLNFLQKKQHPIFLWKTLTLNSCVHMVNLKIHFY